MNISAFPLTIKSINEAGQIEGLAAAFGNVDLGGDRILPGAFRKTLAERSDPMPMLLHHQLDRPIGKWDTLIEVADGLVAKGKITLDVQDGREAYALARDGALRGLSIGYQTVKSSSAKDARRDLIELNLYEVSLVTIPMNPKARVSTIKSIAGPRDLEDILRDGGLSSRKAKAAAAAAWRAINDTSEETDAETKMADILRASITNVRQFVKG